MVLQLEVKEQGRPQASLQSLQLCCTPGVCVFEPADRLELGCAM